MEERNKKSRIPKVKKNGYCGWNIRYKAVKTKIEFN
jgi:hypothetical protein